jgi:hypothetical protein
MKKMLACYFLCVACAYGNQSFAQHHVDVIVHPGNELLSIIGMLSDSAPVEKSTYRVEAEQYFSRFKNDPAVQKARKLPFLNCDFPVRLSWAFYDYPDLKLSQPESLQGYEKLKFTLDQIHDYFTASLEFYKRSNFREFYQAHEPEYQRWIASFNRNLYEEGLLATRDSFYRFIPEKKIVIELGALNCGTYAVPDMQVVNSHFANTMVLVIAYSHIIRDKESDSLEPNFFSPEWTSQLLWHEMGHAYLSNLFEKYKSAIDSLAYIADRDTIIHKNAAGMGWNAYFNESMTQAVTSYLRIKRGIMSEEEEFKRINRYNSFCIMVPGLIDIIKSKYIQNGKYRDFNEFFPDLLKELRLQYP